MSSQEDRGDTSSVGALTGCRFYSSDRVLISRLLLFAIKYKIVLFLQWHYVKGDVRKVMNTYIVLKRKYGCTRRTSTNQ